MLFTVKHNRWKGVLLYSTLSYHCILYTECILSSSLWFLKNEKNTMKGYGTMNKTRTCLHKRVLNMEPHFKT